MCRKKNFFGEIRNLVYRCCGNDFERLNFLLEQFSSIENLYLIDNHKYLQTRMIMSSDLSNFKGNVQTIDSDTKTYRFRIELGSTITLLSQAGLFGSLGLDIEFMKTLVSDLKTGDFVLVDRTQLDLEICVKLGLKCVAVSCQINEYCDSKVSIIDIASSPYQFLVLRKIN